MTEREKKLNKFSKSELIYGIMYLANRYADNVDLLIAVAEQKREQNEQTQRDKRWNEYECVFEEYKKYLKELCDQYGDGETFIAGTLPADKRDKLCTLHKEMLEAAKKI